MSVIGLPQQLSHRKILFEYQLYALEDIILKLEERASLIIRKEIADKEYHADVLYEITYSSHSREIKLNNMLIHKLDFDSENEKCFEYIFNNPGRPIPIAEIEEVIGGELKKRMAHVVRDLGFVGDLVKLFFPVITKSEVKFVNPISKQYATKSDLPFLNFRKIVRQSKVE